MLPKQLWKTIGCIQCTTGTVIEFQLQDFKGSLQIIVITAILWE